MFLINTGALPGLSISRAPCHYWLWHFPLLPPGRTHRDTAAHTHYQGLVETEQGQKIGPHLGLFFSIFGAIIAGIAVIDREEIFD
jgi:hypothetical protein